MDGDEPVTQDRVAIAKRAGELLDALRSARPLVQNITNFVSMDAAANALLALGASPAMVHSAQESGDFAARADSLVVNTGTLSPPFLEGGETAATAAHMLGRPWVLDPVGVGGGKFRNEAVLRLLRHRPSVIRGNASEIISVARVCGLNADAAAPRGVDSAHSTDAALVTARRLARHGFCVVAATGAVDLITDGERVVRLANGHELMTRVTALGCALSAVVAAFCAVGEDAFEATVSALAVYGVAGEMAAEQAQRPGSYRVAFMDMLDAINAADVVARLKVL
jgi:hydroxyethylthiazole kinase